MHIGIHSFHHSQHGTPRKKIHKSHTHNYAHDRCVSLEEYVNICIDVLDRNEVELCREMLTALYETGAAKEPVFEVKDMQVVAERVNHYAEKQPEKAFVGQVRATIGDIIQHHSKQHSPGRNSASAPSTCISDPSLATASHTSNGTSSKNSRDIARTATGGASRDSRARQISFMTQKSLRMNSVDWLSRSDWLPDPSLGTKRRIFAIMDDAGSCTLGKITAVVMMVLVAFSTATFALESMPQFRHTPEECMRLKAASLPLTVKACEPVPDDIFFTFEVLCVAIFTLEFTLRVALVHCDVKVGESGIVRTLNYLKEPLSIIDLLAVLPFYIDICISDSSLGFVSVLRLARILRLGKMAKHNRGVQMVMEVMLLSGQPLQLLLFVNFCGIVFFGSIIYFVECQNYSVADEFLGRFPTGVYVRKDAQYLHDEVSPFYSIPHGLWYVCVAMTTVGYGDYTPTTAPGKVVSVAIFYAGILFLALPIGILDANMCTVYSKYVTPTVDSSKTRTQMFKAMTMHVVPLDGKNWFPSCSGFRRKVFLLFHEHRSSRLSNLVNKVCMSTIFVSIGAMVIETMPEFQSTPSACTASNPTVRDCRPKPNNVFLMIEVGCVSIFMVDYIARAGLVHAAFPEDVGYFPSTLSKRHRQLHLTFKYVTQALNLVDFVTIFTAVLEFLMGSGFEHFSVIRILRLIRLFRLLKSQKLRICASLFANVVKDALPALISLFFLTVLMCVFFASCICFAEGARYSVSDFQDEYPTGVYIRPTADGHDVEVSPFTSIPYGFWWFFVTSTTVGFGDDYPTTTGGKATAIVTFYLGIVLLALPLSIVGQSLNKFYPEWIAMLEMQRIHHEESLRAQASHHEESSFNEAGSGSSSIGSKRHMATESDMVSPASTDLSEFSGVVPATTSSPRLVGFAEGDAPATEAPLARCTEGSLEASKEISDMKPAALPGHLEDNVQTATYTESAKEEVMQG